MSDTLTASIAQSRAEISAPAGVVRARAESSARGRGVVRAIERSMEWLLSAQETEGYWIGELEADTTLESDYILYEYVLGRSAPQKIEKLANYIRQRQVEDGGWNIYAGGPSEINATVKAYFALKLAGDAPGTAHMESARKRVLALGGLEATNSYTRFYLAMVGALGWDWAPAIPPELMLLPKWFYVNLLEMSSWTRGIVVPLTIIFARKPDWRIPDDARVEELIADAADKPLQFRWDARVLSLRNCFLALDRIIKLHERLPWQPLRRRALVAAEQWMREHLERSEGLGAIYPAMMNSIYALMALGYAPDDPLTAREIRFFDKYEIEDEETLRVQPCISPVWDTAIAMVSLEEAGLPADHPALVNAARWLLDNQILGPGDWQYKNPGTAPGGWAFEFRNDFFPDVDDTAFVLMALARVRYPDAARLEKAIGAGVRWLVSMQNRDGGWGAFDKNNDRSLLLHIPFADHNAMIDPSTADVTARVLECLGRLGWPASHEVMRRGIEFLRKDQAPDGSWFGRWGVNYIYGSSSVLRALETVGLAKQQPYCRAADWLKKVQNADGGFGESIASYDDESLKGRGSSTASQTAWAIIAQLAAHGAEDSSVRRAVEYLVENQREDGSWDEEQFTGTGFPRVFYLNYHLYRNSFPLYALARYRNMGEGREVNETMRLSPRMAAAPMQQRGYE